MGLSLYVLWVLVVFLDRCGVEPSGWVMIRDLWIALADVSRNDRHWSNLVTYILASTALRERNKELVVELPWYTMGTALLLLGFGIWIVSKTPTDTERTINCTASLPQRRQ